MTAYNSSQAGDWDDVDTWGGGGYPSLSNDTATLTHAVSYNVDGTGIALGNITINTGGALTATTDGNRILELNSTAKVQVNAGLLEFGSFASPFPVTYRAKIWAPDGSSNRDILDVNSNATVKLVGAYPTGSRDTTLDSNWTTGQSFDVVGDFTHLSVGDVVWVHRKLGSYTSYQTDSDIYSIASVSAYDSGNDKTTLTIAQTAPSLTYNAGGRVLLLNSSVMVENTTYNGANYSIGSTTSMKLQFDTSGSGITWELGCFIYGFRDLDFSGTSTSVTATGLTVCRQTNTQMIMPAGQTLTSLVMCFALPNLTSADNWVFLEGPDGKCWFTAASTPLNGANYLTSGPDALRIVSLQWAIPSLKGIYLSGTMEACQYAFSGTSYSVWEGDISDTENLMRSTCRGILIRGNCSLINDGMVNGAEFNTIEGDLTGGSGAGIEQGAGNKVLGLNTFTNPIDVFSSREQSGNFYQVEGPDNVRAPAGGGYCGSWTSLFSTDGDWQAPDSGHPYIVQLVPNSNCGLSGVAARAPGRSLRPNPYGDNIIPVSAGVNSVSIQVYPVGWSTNLTEDHVWVGLSAEGNTSYSTSHSLSNGSWQTITASLTLAADGQLFFEFALARYEAAAYVLLDIVWS